MTDTTASTQTTQSGQVSLTHRVRARLPASGVDPLDFAPALLRVQEQPPAPLGRAALYTVLALFLGTLAWAMFSHLDIVAVAEGKLIPSSYLKIVQPAEQGIVKEILVREGETVGQGQVLIRMDAVMTHADVKTLQAEFHQRRLALRRIDAQLAGMPLTHELDDPAVQYAQVEIQYAANVTAYQNALAQERAQADKARYDLASAEAIRAKLLQTLPHYIEQERAFDKLARDGYTGKLMATDKQRERIEKEQDLRSQEFVIRSNQALIEQSAKRSAQLTADYRRQLQTERVEIAGQFDKVSQDLAKQEHRSGLLELKAPQAGIVKDLATHTIGTVAAPGTILMTLVPQNEQLIAEVLVSNQDVGFVRQGQDAKLKLSAFQFQKYGMLDGAVKQVSADASEAQGNAATPTDASKSKTTLPLTYKTLVVLKTQELSANGERYALTPGMQVSAEIKLGTRTVLEYLLSPVQKAFHEAGRER